MIARIWHAYTSKENAGAYENLLKGEIFVWIEQKKVRGYKGIQLLRRDLETEVEFTTMMWFDHLASVREFAGEDYENAVVPARAREIMARFDAKSVHCEVRHSLQYDF